MGWAGREKETSLVEMEQGNQAWKESGVVSWSFRIRIGCCYRSGGEALWRRIVAPKYGEEKWGWVPKSFRGCRMCVLMVFWAVLH